MIKEIIKLVLNLFNIDESIAPKINNEDGIIYCKAGNLEIKVEQNINCRSYISGVADKQETITTVDFSYINYTEANIIGKLVFKNDIVFNLDYETKNYNILNNTSCIYATLIKDDINIVFNRDNEIFTFKDSNRFLMIDKAGIGLENNLLGTYFIKKLNSKNKLFLKVNVNPEKVVFSKYCKEDILDQYPTDCIHRINPNFNDLNGINITNKTITSYYPEYYEELKIIMNTFDNELISKILSLVSNLSDEEFKTLFGIDKQLTYQNTGEKINNFYTLSLKKK